MNEDPQNNWVPPLEHLQLRLWPVVYIFHCIYKTRKKNPINPDWKTYTQLDVQDSILTLKLALYQILISYSLVQFKGGKITFQAKIRPNSPSSHDQMPEQRLRPAFRTPRSSQSRLQSRQPVPLPPGRALLRQLRQGLGVLCRQAAGQRLRRFSQIAGMQ